MTDDFSYRPYDPNSPGGDPHDPDDGPSSNGDLFDFENFDLDDYLGTSTRDDSSYSDDPGETFGDTFSDTYDDTDEPDDMADDDPGPNEEFTSVTMEPRLDLRDVRRRPAAHPVPPQRPQPGSTRRRHPPQKPSGPRIWLSTLRVLLVVGAAAVMVSTIFSLWTRPTFFSDEFRAGLNRVQATQRLINIQPSPIPTNVQEVHIGIVAGHSGAPQDSSFEMDPGAVCPDGLTELEINETIARKVVLALQMDQYTVDLLTEFDPRLENYRADVLVSIHTNDCEDYGYAGTGYNASSATSRRTTPGDDERLLDCLLNQYGATTGLPRHQGLTVDMTEYHTFSEVSPDTPTAIIEIGFMRNDRAILTQQPDLIAQGIANGVRCFLRPELYTNSNVANTSAGQ